MFPHLSHSAHATADQCMAQRRRHGFVPVRPFHPALGCQEWGSFNIIDSSFLPLFWHLNISPYQFPTAFLLFRETYFIFNILHSLLDVIFHFFFSLGSRQSIANMRQYLYVYITWDTNGGRIMASCVAPLRIERQFAWNCSSTHLAEPRRCLISCTIGANGKETLLLLQLYIL